MSFRNNFKRANELKLKNNEEKYILTIPDSDIEGWKVRIFRPQFMELFIDFS